MNVVGGTAFLFGIVLLHKTAGTLSLQDILAKGSQYALTGSAILAPMVIKHYRLSIPKGTVVPSITPIYFGALLVENEIEDQFGIQFADLVLDFKGSLYLEEEVRAMPFCKVSTAQKQS